YKRGSFYPVCIRSDQQKRDTARELEIAALVKDDLRIEPDKARWFPLYDAPGMGG
ncbi:PspA-associated protein PspAB, partial [Streptomyces sp. CBMA29]|uniref:PspA-associated protein PspAB n=1 Tax=Streptomyces sp. CBMA29 TaxID=1896314 RepID=UPI0039801A3F